jgi:hypothetical protein
MMFFLNDKNMKNTSFWKAEQKYVMMYDIKNILLKF